MGEGLDSTVQAFLRSWPCDPWIIGPLLLTALIYTRGWMGLRVRSSHRFGFQPLFAFLCGLLAIFLALASPVEPFSSLLLSIHMMQHLLLMLVAPPLLWMGAPLLPMLRGLPIAIRRQWIGPLLRAPLLRAGFLWLMHPVVAWLLFIAAMWIWHTPQLYERTLGFDNLHYLEHGCFLGTALLFWYPVIQPFPSRPRFSRWVMLPYLLLADIQNTILAAILTFSDRVLYPHYANVPRIWNISPLEDQAIAGVIMWVPGSISFLVPLIHITTQLLYGNPARQPGRLDSSRSPLVSSARRIALPIIAASSHPVAVSPHRRVAASSYLDILNIPLLGNFLRWHHGRLVMQIPLFLAAFAVIVDGLSGPEVAGMNLAGVLPWIHWRGLVVLGLLGAGNLFCMACPFMLPRSLARRWLPGAWAWPRPLRTKWLAVFLLVLFFWAYEAFSLWASPWWTAWIAIAYFLAVLVIDGFFRGASFCKYVCPIGQFNSVQSLASPLEIRVRAPDLCLQCQTKDCIRGRHELPGCELHLFQPRKGGNLDCTFCLDCVHACPHDNVGILGTPPGKDLITDRHRSGVGRLSRRFDVAVMVVVLVFAAFANAAGMVAPVLALQDRLTAEYLISPTLVVSASLLVGLLILPMLLIGVATFLGRWWSNDHGSWRETAARFSYSLVPIGFSMWLAHYTFHFFTSASTIVPVVQRFVAEWGIVYAGEPAWDCACCMPAAPWLLHLEILFLDFGLLLSLYLAYRIAGDRMGTMRRACTAVIPWAGLILLLFAAGIWILFQPMEMRGTLQG